jgi:hypothetical protein
MAQIKTKGRLPASVDTPAAGYGTIFYDTALKSYCQIDEDGTITALNASATGLSDIVDDVTPQLGGDLDLNGKGLDFPTTANISDCLDEDTMSSDSATALATQQSIKAYVDTNAGISDVVDDTTPQLGGDLDLNGNNIDFPSTANISDCLDEDDMSSDSSTSLATQQSIKAYTDTEVTNKTESFVIACSDETTALTTGTAKVTFRMPYAFTVTAVRASLTGAGSTSGTTTIDINETGTTILSTKLTIDNTEKTSTTAATAAVISDSALANDAEITIDIDAISGGADETGLKVYIIGHQ